MKIELVKAQKEKKSAYAAALEGSAQKNPAKLEELEQAMRVCEGRCGVLEGQLKQAEEELDSMTALIVTADVEEDEEACEYI